jgi:transcription elongation GreA/GreB family factor
VATKESELSVAFTKEDRAETASEILLPYRPVSPHPNLVTEAGLKALELQLHQAREAHETAQKIEDVNERRRQAATPLRDARYFAARVRTAQVTADPASTDIVAFGSTVTFRRDDGRVQKYRIVGEDEADPKAGSISFLTPVATLLMGKAVGDVVGASGQELETIAISWSLTGRNRSRNGRFARPKTDLPQIRYIRRRNRGRAFAKTPRSFESQRCGDVLLYVAFTYRPRVLRLHTLDKDEVRR